MSDTLTPFLKLHKPPFDAIPWDEAVNGNMDTIDGVMAQFMNIPNFTGVWKNSTPYVAGQVALDPVNSVLYEATNTFTSSDPPATFAEERAGDPAAWVATTAGFGSSLYAPLVSPAFTGDPTAPTPAVGDSDTSIATTAFVSAAVDTALNNAGRNKLHNGQFAINQRGLGPWTTNGSYTSDRWVLQLVSDTVNVSVGPLLDAHRTQIQDEEATVYLGNTFTGSAAAGAFNLVAQRIENVRRLAGKIVTVSFWAIASTGTPKLGINFLQFFGTGGSPSASVRAANGFAVQPLGTFSRFSATFIIPSILGKTLGSNGDNYTALEFWFSSGATLNAASGNIGVQSGAIAIWGVQLEIGSVATQFEKIDSRLDVTNCSRYFQVIQFDIAQYGAAGTGVWQTFPHPVAMRNTPVVNVAGGATVNVGGVVLTGLNYTATRVGFTFSATGGASYSGTLTLNADL